MTKKLTVNLPNSSKEAIVECPPYGLFRNKAVYEIEGLEQDELRGVKPKGKLETISQAKPEKPEVVTETPVVPADTLFDTETS